MTMRTGHAGRQQRAGALLCQSSQTQAADAFCVGVGSWAAVLLRLAVALGQQ